MPKQKLDGPEISGPSIDQGSFCVSQRMCPEQPWVQSNAADPLRYKARILARCHVAVGTTTAREQELAGSLVGRLYIIIDSLASLLAQFKPDRHASFLFDLGRFSVQSGLRVRPSGKRPVAIDPKPTSPARLRVRPRTATVQRFTTRRADPSLIPRRARRQRRRLCLEAPDRAGRLRLAGGE